MAESSSSGGGAGVAGLLGVLFVALKLTGVIAWSWWWVTAPFWIGRCDGPSHWWWGTSRCRRRRCGSDRVESDSQE